MYLRSLARNRLKTHFGRAAKLPAVPEAQADLLQRSRNRKNGHCKTGQYAPSPGTGIAAGAGNRNTSTTEGLNPHHQKHLLES